ncbi:MAG TPA: response regulator, partial [Myxococcaceae bacterium]|nr:response regulator [Myxococcaceae bacterium]
AAGHQVSVAADGVEALERLRVALPQVMLLDVTMPRKDGFGVLAEIRRTPAWAALPVILLTAVDDMEGKIRGMQLGADDFITKPFRISDLTVRLDSALTIKEYRHQTQTEEETLARLRAVDPATGAGTYSQLKVRLETEFGRARRHGRAVAALVLGLENYAGLRAKLGRGECERWMGLLAQRLRAVLRDSDGLFRLDADEFIVLLPETDFRSAHLAALRLLAIADGLVEEGGRDTAVRATVGGASFPEATVDSGESLLQEAHRSLLEVVNARGGKRTFDPPP